MITRAFAQPISVLTTTAAITSGKTELLNPWPRVSFAQSHYGSAVAYCLEFKAPRAASQPHKHSLSQILIDAFPQHMTQFCCHPTPPFRLSGYVSESVSHTLCFSNLAHHWKTVQWRLPHSMGVILQRI